MGTQMQAAWRTMVGTALLWAALAALVYVPSSSGGQRAVIVAVLGFFSFCGGLALVTDGVKRGIVQQLRREKGQ